MNRNVRLHLITPTSPEAHFGPGTPDALATALWCAEEFAAVLMYIVGPFFWLAIVLTLVVTKLG